MRRLFTNLKVEIHVMEKTICPKYGSYFMVWKLEWWEESSLPDGVGLVLALENILSFTFYPFFTLIP